MRPSRSCAAALGLLASAAAVTVPDGRSRLLGGYPARRYRLVSQHPETFTSAQGVALDPMPAEIQRMASFFLMHGPAGAHRYRRLISSA